MCVNTRKNVDRRPYLFLAFGAIVQRNDALPARPEVSAGQVHHVPRGVPALGAVPRDVQLLVLYPDEFEAELQVRVRVFFFQGYVPLRPPSLSSLLLFDVVDDAATATAPSPNPVAVAATASPPPPPPTAPSTSPPSRGLGLGGGGRGGGFGFFAPLLLRLVFLLLLLFLLFRETVSSMGGMSNETCALYREDVLFELNSAFLRIPSSSLSRTSSAALSAVRFKASFDMTAQDDGVNVVVIVVVSCAAAGGGGAAASADAAPAVAVAAAPAAAASPGVSNRGKSFASNLTVGKRSLLSRM